MKAKLESVDEDAVVTWAERKGILVTKLNLFGRRGWPDRCFWLYGGRPVLIEFKRKGEKPEPLQAYTIGRLKGLGYEVESFDNADDAIRYLSTKLEAAKRPTKRSDVLTVALQRRVVR